MRTLWRVRELSTVAILVLEIAFFTWYLWPGGGRSHPFLNPANGLLVLKYSSIYGIAAVGAAIVIICGGIDLAPGAIIALSGVVAYQHSDDRLDTPPPFTSYGPDYDMYWKYHEHDEAWFAAARFATITFGSWL